MDSVRTDSAERLRLVAANSMRIAGIQGVYGDPCGVEIIPVSLTEGLVSTGAETLLIDAGSVGPLFEVLGRFRESCPVTRLLVIGLDADETYIECVIGAGAKGWLAANALPAEFRVALDNIRDGSIWAPRKVLSRLVENRVGQRGAAFEVPVGLSFTPRERQIIGLLLSGRGNREIGAKLGIDPVTVKAHLGRIMRKAGVGNRVELTMFAINSKTAGHGTMGAAQLGHRGKEGSRGLL